jgi:hypothetical protein
MTTYRATDEQIDREIATLEKMSRVRLRRATDELNDLDKDLRELRKEKARRAARAAEMVGAESPASSADTTSER